MTQDLKVNPQELEPRDTHSPSATGTAVAESGTSLGANLGANLGVHPDFEPGAFSAQRYADSLMDELFQGVEHLIETGAELPRSKEPDVVVKPISFPQISLPLTLLTPPPEPPQPPTDPTAQGIGDKAQPGKFNGTTRFLSGAVLMACATAVTLGISQRDRYLELLNIIPARDAIAALPDEATVQFGDYVQQSLEVLRDSATSSGTLTALAPSGLSTSALNPNGPLSPSLTAPSLTAPSLAAMGPGGILTPQGPGFDANAAAGLPTVPVASVPGQAIPGQAIPGQTVASAGQAGLFPATGPGLAGTAVASATTLAPATPQIIDRVYIPVYQTPQGFVPVVPGVPVPAAVQQQIAQAAAQANATVAAAPGNANASAAKGSGSGGSAPGPTVAVAAAPGAKAPAANKTATASTAASTAALPKLPVLAPGQSGQLGPAGSSAGAPNVAIAAPAAPAIKHTLVGLLEMETGSAALFEIDGITRRVTLGEKVGSSGWTLAEVKNQEAVVRRNGEVRSVFVGQTF